MASGELQDQTEHEQDQRHIDDALKAFGLEPTRPVLPDVQPFFLWPENVAAFQLFQQLHTQWRHDFGGPTGLDYTAVLAHMRQVRVPRRKFDELYAAVRMMEGGALEGFAERARRRQEMNQ